MMVDRLEEMVSRQLDLQRHLGYDFTKMTMQERLAYIREMYMAIIKELGEALDETTWKPWATGEPHIHTEKYLSELNDVWQLLCNMWFVALPDCDGVDVALMMSSIHEKKVRVNRTRRDNAYDGWSTKCPTCRRALDDPGVRCDGTEAGCDSVMSVNPHSS